MKRIASIQDISCLGRCSLTVALPVISAMAVECAIVPTAVLSTHTMFPGFISRDLSDQLLPIARHWKSQNVTLDAICTGYLASPLQTEEVCRFFDLLAGPDTLLFVDPAMADGGRLYAGFGPDFPGYMRRVVARAHVAVPNVTEACLLTGTPYRETEDLSWWRDLLRRVADLGPRYPVLTGVPFGPDRLGVLFWGNGRFRRLLRSGTTGLLHCFGENLHGPFALLAGNGFANQLFNLLQFLHFVNAAKADGRSVQSGAAGTSDAVHI